MSLMGLLSIFVGSVLLVRSTQGASIKFWPAHQPGYRADAQTARRRSIWRRWVLVLSAGFACFSVSTTPADAAGGVRIYGYDALHGAIANLSRVTVAERTAPTFSARFASGSGTAGVRHWFDPTSADTTAARLVATKPGPSAVAEAQAEAARISAAGGKRPTMTSAAVERTTGKVYTGTSGYKGPVPPEINLPNPSRTAWTASNCAEVAACAKAIADGAKLDNLDVAAVYTKNGVVEPPCANCSTWVPGKK
jgi:hypothetical protein